MSRDARDQSLKRCFVISPIGSPNSDVRRRADGVLRHIIEPAVGERYDVKRADDFGDPGILTDVIVAQIREADLVIADLSGCNGNVLYELALRHTTAKPTVQMIESGQVIPSDIRSVRTIFFRPDLMGREPAIKELKKAVAAAEANPEDLGNPVVRALRIKELTAGTPSDEKRMLAEILRWVQQLAAKPPQPSVPANSVRAIGRALMGLDPTEDASQVSCTSCGEPILFATPVVPSSTGSGLNEQLCPSCAQERGIGTAHGV